MKSRRLDKIFIILASVLLAGQFIFQLHLAKLDAQTTDEAVHLFAGYTYLTKHDFRFNPEHPVLVKAIAATPLLFMDIKLPSDFDELWNKSSDFFYDNWKENRILGEEFLYQSGNEPEVVLFWGRFPMVILTLLLGVAILLVSRKLFSSAGTLIAICVYVFNPIVLAHGHLITTDIAVALGYFVATITAYSFFKDRSWRSLLWLTLALAFTLLVKFTAIILIPGILILFAYSSLCGIVKKGDRLKTFGQLVIAGLISWFLIWGCYGFKTTEIPRVESVSQSMIQKNSVNGETGTSAFQQTKFDKAMNIISPLLLPRDYFKGLFMVVAHVGGGHDSYLLGQFSKTGWWYYFPVVFVAKSSIPALLIFLMATYSVFVCRKKRTLNIFLLISAAIFLLFAMTSKANLGVRHVMPIVPLLILLSANLTNFTSKIMKVVIITLVSWALFEIVISYPYYLSYYNQLFGGKNGGYKIASDSNLDWGRDLKEVANYIKTHEFSPLYVEYGWDGPSSLLYYGINAEDGSMVSLDTIGYLVIGGSAVDSPEYFWLDSLPIYDKITPSVFVYKLNGTYDE